MAKFEATIADAVRVAVHDDVLRASILTTGEVFFVIEDSDTDYAKIVQRYGKKRVFLTLKEAYDACTSNRGDTIFMSAMTTHSVATGWIWSKSRINVIGLDGGDRLVQQGTKLELAGVVDSAYVLRVTGTRNSFRNLKIIQSSTHANALHCVEFGGEGNLYKNCSFLFGVVNNLGSTDAVEAVVGEDSGTFINCSFGTDVLLTSAARNIMTLTTVTGGNADGAKGNRFIDCEWVVQSSNNGAVLLKVLSTAGAKFLNRFINPAFIAVKNATNVAIAITNAIQSVSGFNEGSVCFTRPATHNCTNGCDTLTANVSIAGAPVFSSNAWEGAAPA
jgi:hypothetical protein